MLLNPTTIETASKAPLAPVLQFKQRKPVQLDPVPYKVLSERFLANEKQLNLIEFLMPNFENMYFVHVTDDYLGDVGIFPNDILIVDSSYKCQDGDIVVGYLNGELELGALTIKGNKTFLYPACEKYEPVEITDEDDFVIGGLVMFAIHPITDLDKQGGAR